MLLDQISFYRELQCNEASNAIQFFADAELLLCIDMCAMRHTNLNVYTLNDNGSFSSN